MFITSGLTMSFVVIRTVGNLCEILFIELQNYLLLLTWTKVWKAVWNVCSHESLSVTLYGNDFRDSLLRADHL